jgi:hypothetical protein
MNLFPRHHRLVDTQEQQRRCKAHRILDRLKAGVDVPDRWVAWALAYTGDVDGEPIRREALAKWYGEEAA